MIGGQVSIPDRIRDRENSLLSVNGGETPPLRRPLGRLPRHPGLVSIKIKIRRMVKQCNEGDKQVICCGESNLSRPSHVQIWRRPQGNLRRKRY